MKIHIGTKSPVKIQAVVDTISDYNIFKNAIIKTFMVNSGVSNQPMSLEETITGAKNRAEVIFKGSDYSFGIESGLMVVPESKTGYMNVSVCAVCDGVEFHLGLASCFEFPREVTRLAVEEDMEISTAFKKAGLTTHDKIGYAEGGIGFMSKGRLCSVEYYKQSVLTALIHLENKDLF